MNRRTLSIALFAGLAVTIITVIVYSYQLFFTPNILVRETEKAYLYIPPGATIKNVADSLYHNKLMHDPVSFMFVSKLLKYHESVKPGRYALSPKMTNLQAVRHLRAGIHEPVKLTFTNARRKDELAAKLCRATVAEPHEFDSLVNDVAFVETLGFDTVTVACMFLPNTYEVFWTTNAEGILKRMKREYDAFWNEDRLAKASAVGLTPVQVSILASVVEAETKLKDEKPTVAGLYLNRLNRNMPLESDPTVVFAVGDFSIRRVLNTHLEIVSPYNTYRNTGLPPGPILIPELSSIEAVLNAKDHNYLYMCAKEDFSGRHNFAATYREHINNANRYRAALNRAKIMK